MAENIEIDVSRLTFERAIEELETIVKRLEDGKVPLEESVTIYERGEALKRRCEELLRQAEARVELSRHQITVLEEQLRQSEIGVDQARADAEGRVNEAEAKLAAAEAQLAQASASYAQAKWDREAYTKLFKKELIAEQQGLFPERKIITHFDLAGIVDCDDTRIGQLFSNLLSNALKYGHPQTPVRIEAETRDGQFVLSITNYGDKISETVLQRIFQPFSRGEVKQGKEGLGLGLYIAAEIARAHGGDLSVSSTEKETSFTLRMPACASSSSR